ncbi:glycosyltransferase [Chloroflexales bacterium ZM16-3]|nr:glycosyltransferase [Chloroflexales bacterium ZM16-3]
MILPTIIVVVSAALILLVARDIRRLRRIPHLAAPAIPAEPPLISILIPARNEERSIGRCVRAALAQSYPQIEVIVVDDGSTDGTGAILAEVADVRLRVIAGRPLPDGWVGKCNACQQIGEQASGAWLLFLDADTVPAPDLVAALLSTASIRRLDLLTIFPFLELGTFWERVVLPPFLALITALFPFEQMERPDVRPDQVLANGQCIFVRRAAYEGVGGHAAVRGEVLEDVRLAQAIRAAGGRVGIAEGMAFLRVRMYTSGREVAEGLMKNAAAGYRSGGGRSAWAMAGLILETFGPAWLLLAGLAGLALGDFGLSWAGLGGGGLSLLAALSLRATLYRRLYGLPAAYGLLWPLGLLAYLLIAGIGMWRVRSGRGVIWKGRTYSG